MKSIIVELWRQSTLSHLPLFVHNYQATKINVTISAMKPFFLIQIYSIHVFFQWENSLVINAMRGLTVGAELTGYGDFHFTFVSANGKKKDRKPEKPGA